MRRIETFKESGQSRIGADSVVVTVSAYHRAVKAGVSRAAHGDGGKLCRKEIVLGNAEFFVEYRDDVELYRLRLFAERSRADEKVEFFTDYRLTEGLEVVLVSQVRKQVVDVKDGIRRILSDHYVACRAVGKSDGAVERKGSRDPLIFADPAVIMGLEEGHSLAFEKRDLLEIQPRRVDMRRADPDPLRDGFCPDGKEK